MARRAATSSERSGTMQKAMPVETVWMGRVGIEVVDGEAEARRLAAGVSWMARRWDRSGAWCRRRRAGLRRGSVTGMGPTRRSRVISEAPRGRGD
jgi:hypothetical protein